MGKEDKSQEQLGGGGGSGPAGRGNPSRSAHQDPHIHITHTPHSPGFLLRLLAQGKLADSKQRPRTTRQSKARPGRCVPFKRNYGSEQEDFQEKGPEKSRVLVVGLPCSAEPGLWPPGF